LRSPARAAGRVLVFLKWLAYFCFAIAAVITSDEWESMKAEVDALVEHSLGGSAASVAAWVAATRAANL
jgi:hypothetical protein